MKFINLTKEQIEQVQFQIAAHQHVDYEVDIYLSSDTCLPDFRVFSQVMRPELMTSLKFAQFLYKQTEIDFKNKKCWDMGCGCGILGVVLAIRGAQQVFFSDICPSAVKNTKYNIEKDFKHKKLKIELKKISTIYKGDLFDSLYDLDKQPINNEKLPKMDFIIFNHPFFADDPSPDYPVSSAMLNNGDLLNRFFKFCTDNENYRHTEIIMPFFGFADFPDHTSKTSNNPEKVAKNHGYSVKKLIDPEEKDDYDMGLQNGSINFYKIFRTI